MAWERARTYGNIAANALIPAVAKNEQRIMPA